MFLISLRFLKIEARFEFAQLAYGKIQNKGPNFEHLKRNQNIIPLVKISLAQKVNYRDEIQFQTYFHQLLHFKAKLTSISFLRTDLI